MFFIVLASAYSANIGGPIPSAQATPVRIVLNFSQTILTEGSSWTVPADWTNGNNTIEVIGGGGMGYSDTATSNGAGGGGGGAYAKSVNVSLTPGSTVTYQIGRGGNISDVNGSDTFFNRTSGTAGTCADTTSVCAKGGRGATNATGGAGGDTGNSFASGTGSAKFAGGAGGTGHTNADSGGGGGGAAGPGAAGGGGGAGSTSATNNSQGGGGGGGGAGSAGSAAGTAGGNGGNGHTGTGKGVGANNADGTNGTDGTGGGGGGGDDNTSNTGMDGGNGATGGQWSTAGSGGGGGGAGDFSAASLGGDGGLYGAGGGGGKYGGRGAPGLIVITYNGNTPTNTSWTVPADWNNSNNTIEVIGAGASGYSASNSNGSTGGGGGAYAKATNVSLTPGTSVAYSIGKGGRKTGVGLNSTGLAGGATYFCNSTSNCSSASDTAVVAGSNGGTAGTNGTTANGAGGTVTVGTGLSGGNGGDGNNTGDSGGGGGGGGQAAKAGQTAGNGGTSNARGGGGGGGAGDDSGTQSSAGSNSTSATGGAGGNGRAGTGDAAGTGGGGDGGNNGASGTDGWTGNEWTSAGAGGGGGGAGDNTSAFIRGGDGGFAGGGGGGGIWGGFGGNGIIVITYEPIPVSSVTVSGTIYNTDRTTPYDCSADNLTVRVKVNGAGDYTGTCTANTGAYSISSVSTSSGSIVTAYLDGETPDAVDVTRADGDDLTMDLYQDNVILNSDDGSALTNANIGQWDGDDDADIPFTSNSGTLSFTGGGEIYIPTTGNYAPGGAMDIWGFYQAGGTVTGGSFGWSLSGLEVDGGSFTNGSGGFANMDSLIQHGGTVNLGSGDVSTGYFELTSGTFTSTSGTFTVGHSGSSDYNFWNHSGGTFNHNNGTVYLDIYDNDCTADPFVYDFDVPTSEDFYNLTVDQQSDCHQASVETHEGESVTVNHTLNLTSGFLVGDYRLAGTGNLVVGAGADGGYTVTFTGSSAQTYSYTTGGFAPTIVVDKTGGSVTPAGGTTALTGAQLMVTAGTFTAPSGNLELGYYTSSFNEDDYILQVSSGATFNHNNGTLIAAGGINDCTNYNHWLIDVPTTLTVNNFTVNQTNDCHIQSLVIGSGDTLVVAGTLTLSNGLISDISGALEVQGNVSIGAGFDGLELGLALTGSSAQTWTQSASVVTGMVTINKTNNSDTVTLAGNANFGGGLTVTKGTFSQGASYDMTTGAGVSVGANGTWFNLGTGDVTLGGDVSNSGTITLRSNNAGCAGSDDIVLTSTNTTKRTWSGAGTFALYNLTVSYMQGSMTTYSSTNSGNNVSWTFAACGIDISGLCLQNDGETPCTDIGTIRFAVDGVLQVPGQTTIAGTWSIAGIDNPPAGSVITVYIDKDSPGGQYQATAVTKYDGSGDITNMVLILGTITIGSDDNTTVTNQDMAAFTHDDNPDVGFTAGLDDDDTYYFSAYDEDDDWSEALLLNTTGGTYAPGGYVGAYSYFQGGGTTNGGSNEWELWGGNEGDNAGLNVLGGTFNATSDVLEITGYNSVLNILGGTFNGGTGTVHLGPGDYTSVNIDDSATAAFNDVEVDKGGCCGGLDIHGTWVINGDINYVSSGYNQFGGDGTIELSGNFTSNTINSSGYSTLKFVGTGNQTVTETADGEGGLPPVIIDKPSGTLTFVGDFKVVGYNQTVWGYEAGTVDMSASSIHFAGEDPIIDAAGMNFNDVILQTGGCCSATALFDSLHVLGDLDIITAGPSGFVNGETRPTIYVGGDLDVDDADDCDPPRGGCSDERGANFVLNGTGAQTLTDESGHMPTGSITINKASGTVTLDEDLTTYGNLIVTAGTFDQGADNDMTVNGTVTVSSGATWNNTGMGDVTLGGNVTNNGTVTLDSHGFGCSDADDIVLTSTNTTKRTWSGSGTFVLADLTVSYMQGTQTTKSSTNAGNNTNWTFAGCGVTVSGTIYSDEGSTAITSGPTVRIKLNGAGDYSATANGSGAYSIASVPVGTDKIITIYIDGASADAAMVLRSGGDDSNLTGINLYQNYLIVRSENASPVSTSDLGTYDGDDDADLFFTANAGVLNMNAGTTLYVNAGDTFRPGGNVNADGLKIAGTYDNATNNPALTVGGNLTIASDGTFTKGTGALTLNEQGTQTLTDNSAGQDLGDVKVAGATADNGVEAWWDASWSARRKIIFSNAASSTSLTDFPVLVSLDSSNIDYSKTQADGSDLRFVDADGSTLLSYDVEQWDPDGTSLIWVKVPTLSNTNSDFIWMYYGMDQTSLSFDISANGNTDGNGVAWDGSHLRVVDGSGAEVYSYNADGSYTGTHFDTAASGNTSPVGINWDGTHFWITDDGGAEVYSYNADGSYTGTHFDTAASGNGVPEGIAWNGTYFWVTDNTDALVYRYNSNGTYSSLTFSTSASGNTKPSGIVWDGTYFWISDSTGGKVYKYNADGSYADFSFSTRVAGVTAPWGLGWDGTYLYVSSSLQDKIYRFVPATGLYYPFTYSVGATGNGSPEDAAWDGAHFWVTDYADAKVYEYNADWTYANFSFSTSASGNANPVGIVWDGAHFWIADQIDAEVYEYNASGSYTGTHFDTAATGNALSTGIAWDGTYFWIVDNDDGAVYKYNANGTSASFSFDVAGFGLDNPWAIAWDGTYFWITDLTDDLVCAFATDGTFIGCPLDVWSIMGSNDMEGLLWTPGQFWMVDNANDLVYRYDAPDPAGVWSSGYAGVWHLDDAMTDESTGGIVEDSAAGEFVGIQHGNDDATAAIGLGQTFDGNDYVDFDNQFDSDANQSFTLTAWANFGTQTATNNYPGIVSKSDSATNNKGYGIYVSTFDDGDGPINQVYGEVSDGTTKLQSFGAFADDSFWHQYQMVVDRTNDVLLFYTDGVLTGATDISSVGSLTNTKSFYMGLRDASNFFNGNIDEARISGAVHSPDWINAEYRTETNQMNTFAPEETQSSEPAAWWDESWTARRPVYLNNDWSDSSLTNFPVLVVLNSSNIDYAKTQNSGQDIRFVDSDGSTALSYQIESWNESGNSYVWVKVPSLANSTTDYIWMYYGNSGASDAQAAASVWDSNYKGVWHFNDDGQDATSNDNDGSENGSLSNTAGVAGGAVQFASGAYVNVPSATSLNTTSTLTWSVWFNNTTSSFTNGMAFMSRADATSSCNGINMSFVDDQTVLTSFLGATCNGDALGYAGGGEASISDGQWHQVTITKSGTATAFYFDGNPAFGFADTLSGSFSFNGQPLRFGRAQDSYWDSFVGKLDEARVSNVARNDDWVHAEYRAEANQMAGFGAEQGGTVPPTTVVLGSDVKMTTLTIAAGQTLSADGAHNLTLTGSDPEPWCSISSAACDSSWLSRRKITFDNSTLASQLVDFPVLVKLDSTNIDYSKTQNAGQDLRFVDADGVTPLSYEIEKWDETGTSYVWVRVPYLANTNSDYIWMYYNNASATYNDGAANRIFHVGTAASGTSWTNQSNALVSDDARATFATTNQNPLIVKGFGFDIPSDATITGFEIDVEGNGANATAGNRSIQVGLTKNGTALAGSYATAQNLPQTTDDWLDFGANGSLFGTTWSASDINSSNFGVMLRAGNTNSAQRAIDYLDIQVWFSTPTGPDSVWNSSYKGVWHFNSINDAEPDFPVTPDSTANQNWVVGEDDDGCTTYVTADSVGTGAVAGGLNSTGTECMNGDLPVMTSSFTVDGWIKTSELGSDDQTFFVQTEDWPNNGFWLIDNGQYDSNIMFGVYPQANSAPCGTGVACVARSVVNDGQWHKLTGVYDGTNLRLYVDSVLRDTRAAGSYTYNPDPYIVFGPDSGHDVSRDEWRVSDTARSADWIKAEYNAETGAMDSYGKEETYGSLGVFVNNGTFVASTGTVTLAPTGTSATVAGSGSISFYNFTANAAGKSIQFAAGKTIGIAGALTLAGEPDKPLNLRSDSSGVQWTVSFSGTASLAFVAVVDSACAGGSSNISVGETSISRGNNGACWIFVGRGAAAGGIDGGPGGSGATSGGASGGGNGGSDNGNTAAYSFVGATTIPHTGTSASIDAPKPDGAQAGDLAIVYLYVSDNSGTKGAGGAVQGETGWVFMNNNGVPVWDGSAYGRIFAYKVLDSSDNSKSSFAFTFAGITDISGGNGAGGRVYVYRAPYPGATVVSAGDSAYSATSTSHTAPTVTAPTNSSLVIVVAKAVNDGTTVSAPSGFTEDYNESGRFSASKVQVTAGSTGTLSFTTASDKTLTATIAVSLIQAAATGGGGGGGGGGGSP